MPIKRDDIRSRLRMLSAAAAHELHSAAEVPSYDALVGALFLSAIQSGATRVDLRLDAATLSVRCVDNGAAVRQSIWPLLCIHQHLSHVRAPVLYTAARIARIDIWSSTMFGDHLHKSVRFGDLHSDVTLCSHPSALKLFTGGVAVNVGGLFANLSVRRRAAQEVALSQHVDAVRRRVLVLSLANPQVSVRLESNNVPVFESPARSTLTVSTINEALAISSKVKWSNMNASAYSGKVTLSGFIASNALARTSDISQIVAINGVPLHPSARIFTLIRNVIRFFATGRKLGEPGNPRLHSAFIVTVFCDDKLVSLSPYMHGAQVYGRQSFDIENFIAHRIYEALTGQKDSHDIDACKSLKPRPSRTLEFLTGTPKTPTKRIKHNTLSKVLRRPSSAPVKDNQRWDSVSGLRKLRGCSLRPVSSGSSCTRNVSYSLPLAQKHQLNAPNHAFRRSLSASEIRVQRFSTNSFSVGNASTSGSHLVRRPLSASNSMKRNASSQLDLKKQTHLSRPQTASAVMDGFSKTLPSWKNPCYRPPRLELAAEKNAGRSVAKVSGNAGIDMIQVRISHDALFSMRIIAQVDRKFIICIDANKTLYAVDQHAASERALFERFLSQSNANSIKLERPIITAVSATQLAVAQQHREQLKRWGWQFVVQSHISKLRVYITAVPAVAQGVVLDKSEHLLECIDSLFKGASTVCAPPPFFRAAATAACHTGVRFGDELSKAQCESIVRNMAQCEFPFVCAHGRPSIVPLAVIKKEVN